MENEELAARLQQMENVMASLATTLAATRAELDGLRLVTQAALGALGDTREGQVLLPLSVAAVMEADTAHTLNTLIPEEMLAQRRDWMWRLLPQRTAQAVRQQMPPQP